LRPSPLLVTIQFYTDPHTALSPLSLHDALPISILVYSLEMPADSIVIRMLASLGRIDQTKVRTGKLDDDDWPRLTSAVNLLNDRKLFIDDTAGISPSEMRARSRSEEHTSELQSRENLVCRL